LSTPKGLVERQVFLHAAGFAESKGDIVVTLDADLQNPPSEIPKLVNKVLEGYDVVAGKRMGRQDSLVRRWPSLLMNILISRLTGVKLNDYGCMLRAYRKDVIDCLLRYGQRSVYIPAFTSWIGTNVVEIEVGHEGRKHGTSRYNMLKLLRQCFDLVTAYTLLPIQLISISGAFFAGLGALLAGYLMSYRLYFGTTSALTTFIASLLFFSGIIMVSIGVISEYIVRILLETSRTPLYIIKENTEADA